MSLQVAFVPAVVRKPTFFAVGICLVSLVRCQDLCGAVADWPSPAPQMAQNVPDGAGDWACGLRGWMRRPFEQRRWPFKPRHLHGQLPGGCHGYERYGHCYDHDLTDCELI